MSDIEEDNVIIAAAADAAFMGLEFESMSRVDRQRYLDRARFVLTAVVDAGIIGRNEVIDRLKDHAQQFQRRRVK